MIRLKTFDSYYFSNQRVKMIVFDMAGTTVNENGIIYQTLYNVMKKFKLNSEHKIKVKNQHRSQNEHLICSAFFYYER